MQMKNISYKEKLEEYSSFLIRDGNRTTIVSKLWSKYKHDFEIGVDFNRLKLRGYRFNRDVPNSWITFELAYMKIANAIVGVSHRYILRIILFPLRLVSRIYPYVQYDSDFLLNIKQPLERELLFKEFYQTVFSLLKVNLSYNALKNAYYYWIFKTHVSEQLNVFCEIGSGCCQFAMIHLSQVEECLYLCVDIEEMIPAGYTSLVHDYSLHDAEVYLPHEIQDCMKSHSKKRVLFITPKQFDDLQNLVGVKIDVIVNIESFAEMPIDVVNHYLGLLNNYKSEMSYLYTVNRLTRLVDRSDQIAPKLKNYTLFSHYELPANETLLCEVDKLRTHLKGKEREENIVFLGRLVP